MVKISGDFRSGMRNGDGSGSPAGSRKLDGGSGTGVWRIFLAMAYIFMDECVSRGYKSMLYGSKTYLEAVWKNDKKYQVWLANYVEDTSYVGDYKVWQFTQTGSVDGVSGKVDINVMYE